MTSLLFVLVLLGPAAHPAPAGPFDSLAFLIGSFEGAGKSQMGPYEETLTGQLEVGKSILTVRSQSTAVGTTVFEDLRVFSHDASTRKLRARQFAFGGVATYDVTIADDRQSVTLTEAAFEGERRPPWRYVYTDIKTDGFSYRVENKRGDEWSLYVSGSLKRKKD